MPRRGKDPGKRKARRVRATGKAVDADYAPRPNIRLRAYHGGRHGLGGLYALERMSQAVLEKVQDNIRTNMQGRWTPIQYGPKTGYLALQGTEDHWEIERVSSFRVTIKPKSQYRHIWRGHTRGLNRPIYPRKKPFLYFRGYSGDMVRTKKVRMPYRDPRPTATQLSALARRIK